MTQDSQPNDLAPFVDAFAHAWATPRVDGFAALLEPDCRLIQPVTPIVVGRDAGRREFARLLTWLPDLHGIIDSWSGHHDTVLIAWRLRFTLGAAPYELRIVDRIVVRNGRVAEREAYFDSLAFFLTTLQRPRAWLGYLRYRGWLPGGGA